MKKKMGIFSCILLVLMLAAAPVAADGSTSSTPAPAVPVPVVLPAVPVTVTSTSAVSVVSVTNITMDPEVFFPYEKGSISVTLKNSGDTAVGLSDANLLSEKIHFLDEDTWETMNYIGAGSTLTYTFPVTVDVSDGTYYGLFTVSTLMADLFTILLKLRWIHGRSRLSLRTNPIIFPNPIRVASM